MAEKRLFYIDFLKFIGLTCIIIAHVGSPDLVLMIRCFDVPLMVIISALLAQSSIKKYGKDFNSIKKYFIARIKRLVIPTWIFLVIYFIIRFIFTKELLSFKYYVASFLLTRYGVGYVWIILIYLYCALLIPLFRKIGYSAKNMMIILVIYAVYELIYYFKIGIDNKLLDTTVFYIIPYGVLSYIGYNFSLISKNKKNVYFYVNLFLFFIIGYIYYVKTGTIQYAFVDKYPPRIYFLSYGLTVSLGLLILCKKYDLKLYKNSIIQFISKHSLWIYLWHILAMDVYKAFNLPEIWYIKLIIVYFTAIIIVIIVNKILDLVDNKYKIELLKYLRG